MQRRDVVRVVEALAAERGVGVDPRLAKERARVEVARGRLAARVADVLAEQILERLDPGARLDEDLADVRVATRVRARRHEAQIREVVFRRQVLARRERGERDLSALEAALQLVVLEDEELARPPQPVLEVVAERLMVRLDHVLRRVPRDGVANRRARERDVLVVTARGC
jgi:hypothetical protein